MTLWVRFRHAGAEHFGTLDGDLVQPHTGNIFSQPTPVGAPLPVANVTLLAPVRPKKFIGLWNNFHEMATKQGSGIPTEPLYFLKSPDSIIGPDAPIVPPPAATGRVIYEGELGLVIGRTCTQATEDEAAGAIFGLTCVNDVTALDLFGTDPGFSQWARAKSCDSFGPVGPAIATGLDWSGLRVRVALNGRERQNFPTSDMIIPPARIVALISREMSLHPGDLIACGTSVGALPMRPGTVVEVSIDGIGALRNTYAP